MKFCGLVLLLLLSHADSSVQKKRLHSFPTYDDHKLQFSGRQLLQTSSSSSSLPKCVQCFPGSYSAGGTDESSSSCILCPVGTYADQDGSSSCKSCSVGKTTMGNGSYYEKQCITHEELQNQGCKNNPVIVHFISHFGWHSINNPFKNHEEEKIPIKRNHLLHCLNCIAGTRESER